MQFDSQDFQLTQPQKTLAYAKALQHWVEKAQPPIPGEPCQLMEGVLEFWCTMEPLTAFTDGEVLEDVLSSNWVKITSSRSAEPTQRECSWTSTCWAHARGSFSAAYGEGGPQATATAQMVSQQTTPAQEVVLQQAGPSRQCPTPPPGFAEIAQSLCGDNPQRVVAGIPSELAEDQGPIQMVGSSMLSGHLFQDATSGTMCIDMVTCSVSLVVVGLNPMADECHIPTLWEATDLDQVIVCPSLAILNCSHLECLPWHVFIYFVFSLNIS